MKSFNRCFTLFLSFSLSLFLLIIILISGFQSDALADESVGDNNAKKRKNIGISIGYVQHYAIIDPVWAYKGGLKSLLTRYYTPNLKMEMDKKTGFIYNPIFSIRFSNKWSMTGSFQYGKLIYNGNTLGVGLGPTGIVTNILYSKSRYETKKIDAELLFNSKVTRWMKIFFGPKYQGYLIDNYAKAGASAATPYIPFLEKINFHSLGFGIGAGFTVHLVKGLYLLPNISGIFLAGKDFANSISITNFFVIEENMKSDAPEANFFANMSFLFGGIASLSFAYHIEKINLSIAAGFKVQYLYYTKTPKTDQLQKYDLYYGPNISVIYSF